MSRGRVTNTDALRNMSAGQQRIRRRCTCGRIIVGNPGWWSHLHTKDGTERYGHKFDGRA